jgi:hypothetical protein
MSGVYIPLLDNSTFIAEITKQPLNTGVENQSRRSLDVKQLMQISFGTSAIGSVPIAGGVY